MSIGSHRHETTLTLCPAETTEPQTKTNRHHGLRRLKRRCVPQQRRSSQACGPWHCPSGRLRRNCTTTTAAASTGWREEESSESRQEPGTAEHASRMMGPKEEESDWGIRPGGAVRRLLGPYQMLPSWLCEAHWLLRSFIEAVDQPMLKFRRVMKSVTF